MYEKIPCSGVEAEGIQYALSEDPPGPYESSIIYENRQPNNNLIGFKALEIRSEEAKSLAYDVSVTDDQFPCYQDTTAFSIELFQSISDVLTTTERTGGKFILYSVHVF